MVSKMMWAAIFMVLVTLTLSASDKVLIDEDAKVEDKILQIDEHTDEEAEVEDKVLIDEDAKVEDLLHSGGEKLIYN